MRTGQGKTWSEDDPRRTVSARTPNPWAGPRARPHIDLDSYDQRADEPISQYVQGRQFTLQNAQEAREAYEDCRDVALALRKQHDTLRASLDEARELLQTWYDNRFGKITLTPAGEATLHGETSDFLGKDGKSVV